MEKRPTPLNCFLAFLRLGITAFGGPAMIKYIKELVCKKYNWVKDEDFDHGVALVQTIPGATAMQAAAYAGLKAGGGLCALSSYTGFSIPAFFLILILTTAYKYALDISYISACFNGLKVVVVAIVANATISFGKKLVKSWKDLILVLFSAFFLFKKQNPVIIILICAILGLFFYKNITSPLKSSSKIGIKEIIKDSKVKSLLKFTCWLFMVVLLILVFLYFFDTNLFKLCLIMMKVDFFAYGGGYASLPLMFHEIVDKRGLLDAKVFMDGIALGQITPGPIVITAAFVGFLLYGFLGAVFSTWAIFTPSFFILLITTPFFEHFKEQTMFKRAIRGILSSFVGLLLAVLISFLLAIKWNLLKSILGLIGFIALFYGIDILYVVLITGAISAFIL